ncbi:MAG: glycosyltransferase family 1 protein [Minisyncoccia bacterium]|jgi:glycosyltransferase involved in cell wall biosynthesis
MKIGIDARLLERHMTGIGRYLSDLVTELPRLDKENRYTLFSYRPVSGFSVANMKNVPTLDVRSEGRFQKVISPLWLNFILPRFLKKEEIDIFFSPNNLLPMRSTATKNIVSIMDVFALLNPRFHSPLYRVYSVPVLKRSARRADHVITISECSKRDIVKFLGVSEEKVSVTYPSAAKRFMPREVPRETRGLLRQKYRLPEHFILYVGVIERRKNIEGIIQVADGLNKPDDLPLVLVGRLGYGGEQYVKEISKRKNMHWCGFVADEDMPLFYNIASAFLFPSWYEGFGLPVLEAMQSGLPVVTSNSSSLPEVVGSAGITLAPADYGGFARELRGLTRDGVKRKVLRDAGIARARLFDPERTARGTIEAFKIACRAQKVYK